MIASLKSKLSRVFLATAVLGALSLGASGATAAYADGFHGPRPMVYPRVWTNLRSGGYFTNYVVPNGQAVPFVINIGNVPTYGSVPYGYGCGYPPAYYPYNPDPAYWYQQSSSDTVNLTSTGCPPFPTYGSSCNQ